MQTALTLLSSERYLEKGMGLMVLTERRPADIFFGAKFTCQKRNSPTPPLSLI
jgi:hypothetical protein